MRRQVFFIAAFLSLAINVIGQTIIPLYRDGKVPNSLSGIDKENRVLNKSGDTSISKVSIPTLEVFKPERGKISGAAVIICPGGGYTNLAYSWEGTKVARQFVRMGVVAFVLKYRLPDNAIMKDKSIAPLQDAQSAIRLVRLRAKEWSIDTNKVGIMGFSAGGHLASTAGTHFAYPVIDNKERISLRPSFMILAYPVISFTDSLMHRGSRDRLLGEQPDPQSILKFSNEKQVSKSTPPTFLVHASDDVKVPPTNSISFYTALLKNGVPAELHIYPKGGHGFSIQNKNTNSWVELCHNWMKANSWAF